MGKYNFRDKYYNYSGEDVEKLYLTKFFSQISPYNYDNSSVGSRNNPAKFYTSINAYLTTASVLGNGIFNSYFRVAENANYFICGDGFDTVLIAEGFRASGSYSSRTSIFMTDLTIKWVNIINGGSGGIDVHLKRCNIIADIGNVTANYCKIGVDKYTGIRNTFTSTDVTFLRNAALNIYDNCDIVITATDVANYKNNYIAFNSCRLKIGTETEYKSLAGTTETQFRADFVARCVAQGIIVNDVADMGETLKQGRWIFSNDSCVDGEVIKNSIIHNFEKRRFIYFGYSDKRIEIIPITSSKNVPASFSSINPKDKILVTDGSISLDASLDIVNRNKAYIDSKIIWTGGKQQLNNLGIINNMPFEYGVSIDSTQSLSENPIAEGGIEPNKTYIVRSSDKLPAVVKYNNVNYSTSLTSKNYVFRGVAGQISYSITSGNPAIYEVLDEVQHRTIQMRIVNKIPSEIIKTGNLVAGYWYLVEHDADQNNDADYVEYKGVKYYALDSFIVDADDLTFKVFGNIHLRRCYKDDFDFESELTDKEFWEKEQKPKWFDVVIGDTRCLMKNNTLLSQEITEDDEGNYIASGHPYFYNAISGDAGFKLPPYFIEGAYMQLRLVISTLNPM